MDLQLGAGEDPGRFACSKLTGAPFYDRGRSKSGGGPARAAAAASSAGLAGNAPFKSKVVRNRKKQLCPNRFQCCSVLGCLGASEGAPGA